jgi:hypothetical protein
MPPTIGDRLVTCQAKYKAAARYQAFLFDDPLDDLKLRIGIAGKIRALLFRDIANPPTFAAVVPWRE